jgi:hypothetical protein
MSLMVASDRILLKDEKRRFTQDRGGSPAVSPCMGRHQRPRGDLAVSARRIFKELLRQSDQAADTKGMRADLQISPWRGDGSYGAVLVFAGLAT